MKAAGLSNVQTIPTKVPHWVRGQEMARMLTPVDKPLHMLGIGMSVGTGPRGIMADVVSVDSFDELAKLGHAKIEGKIVLYNEEFHGYGPARAYRASGLARGGIRRGEAVSLVRSIPTPLAIPADCAHGRVDV